MSEGVRLEGKIPPPGRDGYDAGERDRLLYRVASNLDRMGEELEREIDRTRSRIWWAFGTVVSIVAVAVLSGGV